MKTDYTPKMLETVRNFFTDDEWNAIEHSPADYQDYGDNEAELVSQIDYKIYKLFNTNSLKITDLK